MFEDVEVRKNDFVANADSARSESGIMESIEQYIESHDVTFNVPTVDAKVTVSPRNINDDELSLKIKFANTKGRSSVEG